MADTLIRGMEIPKDKWVELLVFPNGYVTIYDRYGKYLANARAATLPEGHGRLVDGTGLYSTLDCGFDVDLDDLPETKDAILGMIAQADTIVPAEGGGEE